MSDQTTPIRAVILPKPMPLAQVLQLIAGAFGIDPSEIDELDGREQASALLHIQVNELPPGEFELEVTIFPGTFAIPFRSDADLAKRLADATGLEILASPPIGHPLASNPYAWLLIQPDGQCYSVLQKPELDPSIVLNRETMAPC